MASAFIDEEAILSEGSEDEEVRNELKVKKKSKAKKTFDDSSEEEEEDGKHFLLHLIL